MTQQFLKLHYDPYVTGQLIGGGASLLGDIFNLFGSSKANREQRDYNTNMIQQQRAWALEDIKNQNQYNSPVEQMNRLKQAKLNPNLIYGTGAAGATGQQSSQPRPTSAPTYTPQNTLAGFQNLGTQLSGAIQAMSNAVAVQAKTTQDIAASQQGVKESQQNVEASKTHQSAEQQGIEESKSRVQLQDLQRVHQQIENTILGSQGRANPADKTYYQELDAQNASAQSEILENQRRASQYLPMSASQQLMNIRDENFRAWALNARQEALQQPTLKQMAQSLSNSIQQNANIDQDTKKKAAETTHVLDSLPQGSDNNTNKAVASELIDYIILALQLSGKKQPGIKQAQPIQYTPGAQNFKY